MTLQVWSNNETVGYLDRFGCSTTFVCNAGVNPNNTISLTMPVRSHACAAHRIHDSDHVLLPVFDTNLQEGTLLERMNELKPACEWCASR